MNLDQSDVADGRSNVHRAEPRSFRGRKAKAPGLRLLNERFMVIQQAMGAPKSRGE
jgi:hypothetical protein